MRGESRSPFPSTAKEITCVAIESNTRSLSHSTSQQQGLKPRTCLLYTGPQALGLLSKQQSLVNKGYFVSVPHV